VRKEHADHAVIGNGKVFIHLKDYDWWHENNLLPRF
jgi:hypothetical protein